MNITQLFILAGILNLALILLEIVYCLYKRNGFYRFQDSITSFGALALAHCANVATVYPLTISYNWIYDHYALFKFENRWWTIILCYIGCDLAFYCFHRAAHRINVFWAAHIAHHTSEEYNLLIAFRGSITQRAISFLFYWPLCVFGFTTDTIIAMIGINLVLNGLSHTRVIRKFPKWIEPVFVSPYHHQVHHAMNTMYWDKNFAGTLAIWDHLFGTYQKQIEPIYYGVSTGPNSWNPIHLNFYVFKDIFHDFMTTKSWSNKWKVLFYPPSFRPQDLPHLNPPPFQSLPRRIKYSTPTFVGSKPYIIFQTLLAFMLLAPIVNPQSFLNNYQKTFLSGLIFLSVHTISLIMEADRKAWPLEILRFVLISVFFFSITSNENATFFQILTSISTALSLLYLFFFIDRNKITDRIERTQAPDLIREN